MMYFKKKNASQYCELFNFHYPKTHFLYQISLNMIMELPLNGDGNWVGFRTGFHHPFPVLKYLLGRTSFFHLRFETSQKNPIPSCHVKTRRSRAGRRRSRGKRKQKQQRRQRKKQGRKRKRKKKKKKY